VLAYLSLTSCESECVPMSGGVLVNVDGAASCDDVAVIVSEGGREFPIERTSAVPMDGAVRCEFHGLQGRTGSFNLTVFVEGQVAASQVVTLQKIDDCNVSAEKVAIELVP